MSPFGRFAFLAVLTLSGCLSASPALAQWTRNGVSPCGDQDCLGYPLAIASDGAGGAAFGRFAGFGSYLPMHLQRVTSSGFKSQGWPDLGAYLGPRMTYVAAIVHGDLGGYLYISVDLSSDINNFRFYMNRVNEDGSYPLGWGSAGVRLSSEAGAVGFATACSDGAGGYYVAWDQDRPGASDVLLVRLDANAQLMPGWPASGLLLNHGVGNGTPFVVSDLQGGVIVVAQKAGAFYQRYAFRVHGDGTLAWPTLPTGALLDSRDPGGSLVAAISDGLGGAYAVVDVNTSNSESDLYLQHVTGSGTIAPGWNPNDTPVTAVNGLKTSVAAISDGGTGLYIGWVDYRTYGTYYLQHMQADATRAAGWPANGIPAATSPNIQDFGSIAPDAMGGVYCIIHDAIDGRVLLNHITAAGVPATGWSTGGLDARPDVPGFNTSSNGVLIVADGQGGAIGAWPNFGVPPVESVTMLTRLGPNQVVGVDLSLVSTQATPQSVTLHWFLTAQVQNYTLQRMPQGSEWTTLATISPDGTGNLIYEDRTMLAGRRYGYRLMTSGPGAHAASPETWVDVPAAFRFALAGARPNPAPRSGMSVAFSLAQNLPASLEMFDLSGRRVMLKDVGPLGAGDHTLRLGSDAHLSPGIFWLTLTQAGKRATSRVVVVES